MNSLNHNLVPIDRCKIINMGGSQYIRVPKVLRDENETKPGDVAVFLRSAKSLDTIIQVEKSTESKEVK